MNNGILFKEPHWFYDKPDGRRLGIIDKGTTKQVLETSPDDTWVKHDSGWSKMTEFAKPLQLSILGDIASVGGDIVEGVTNPGLLLGNAVDGIAHMVDPPKAAKIASVPNSDNMQKNMDKSVNKIVANAKRAKEGEEEDKKEGDEGDETYTDWWSDFTAKNNTSNEVKGVLKNINGIFGMPYQYLPSVDRRLTGTDYGRLYGEKIVSRMPLMLMSPGQVNFMKGYKAGEKEDFLKAITSSEDHIASELMGDGEGMLYQFGYNLKDYYRLSLIHI